MIFAKMQLIRCLKQLRQGLAWSTLKEGFEGSY